VLAKLEHADIRSKKFAPDDKGSGLAHFTAALSTALGPQGAQYRDLILRRAYIFKVSPIWLILAYMVISLGELMLSPMGLSLVSKVAPIRVRGLMMGGWFVATAIGNKLTMIGVYWERWLQSSFFVILGTMALIMCAVLIVLLRPLKKAMPGV
jgi:dipeptide/tripeptide permease